MVYIYKRVALEKTVVVVAYDNTLHVNTICDKNILTFEHIHKIRFTDREAHKVSPIFFPYFFLDILRVQVALASVLCFKLYLMVLNRRRESVNGLHSLHSRYPT